MHPSRRIKTAAALWEKWCEFKEYCDNQDVLTHEFSNKHGEFVSATLSRSRSYTIEGFCSFLKMARSAFYANYANNDKFKDIVTLMREECENDVRGKFELGQIPPQLAHLWMSKFGYSTKTENDISVEAVNIIDDI
jgi:hypothetical protein